MTIEYKYLTPEQQTTTAEQHAFSAEHAHLVATLEAAADPGNEAKAEAVELLTNKVTIYQQAADDFRVLQEQADAKAAADAEAAAEEQVREEQAAAEQAAAAAEAPAP